MNDVADTLTFPKRPPALALIGQDSIAHYVECQVCPWTLVSFLPIFLGGPLLRKPPQRGHDTSLKHKPWALHTGTSRPFFFSVFNVQYEVLNDVTKESWTQEASGKVSPSKISKHHWCRGRGAWGSSHSHPWFFNWKNTVVERGEVVLSTSLTFES